LSHVLRKTLCEHVNGLCPAGWFNEQSITKHWFQYVLVHIVGPLAATTPLLFKERSGWGTVDRVWQPVWRVASGEHQLSSWQAPLGVWRPVNVRSRRYQSLLGTYSVFPVRPVGRCEQWCV